MKNLGNTIQGIIIIGVIIGLLYWKFKPKNPAEEYENNDIQYEFVSHDSDDETSFETSDNSNSSYTSPYNQYNNGGYIQNGAAQDQPSSSNNDNSYWENYYGTAYSELERQIEREYNSLTNVGTRYNNNNGNPDGTTGRNDPYIAVQLSRFHQKQNDMRNMRNEAATKGIIISASYWESANVNP